MGPAKSTLATWRRATHDDLGSLQFPRAVFCAIHNVPACARVGDTQRHGMDRADNKRKGEHQMSEYDRKLVAALHALKALREDIERHADSIEKEKENTK